MACNLGPDDKYTEKRYRHGEAAGGGIGRSTGKPVKVLWMQ
jgi:hypothetical protein